MYCFTSATDLYKRVVRLLHCCICTVYGCVQYIINKGRTHNTSWGPYTVARTFVFPCSKRAEPSACANGPTVQLILRNSCDLLPSIRKPNRSEAQETVVAGTSCCPALLVTVSSRHDHTYLPGKEIPVLPTDNVINKSAYSKILINLFKYLHI